MDVSGDMVCTGNKGGKMNRTQKLAFWSLGISLVIIIVIHFAGCGELSPDVNCDCQTCEDCLLTVEEGKALVRCINRGKDPLDCLGLYLWETEDRRQAWLDVVE